MADYKRDWDRRAEANARGFVASHDWQNEERFQAGAERDGALLFEFSGLDPARRHGAALEIGCGIGRLLGYVTRHFDRIVGVDVSSEMIRQARERLGEGPGLLVAPGDGRIPTDETFDFVYSYTVFQHIRRAHTHAYIAEVRRLLKPRGVAVLHFVEPYGLRRNLQAIFHLDPLSTDTLRFRYFRPAEVERVCRRNELRIEERRKVGVYGLYRITTA